MMDEDVRAMTRALFGDRAVQVPCHLIVQDMGDRDGMSVVAFVGASAVRGPHPLRYGSTRCHQLLHGDALFRPHRGVWASDKLVGCGLTGLAREAMAGGDLDRWEQLLKDVRE